MGLDSLQADAPALKALPAELAALDSQFKILQAERVTAPFETAIAKLNASYLAGLDRALATAKKAGRLDDVLALEAEKKLVPDKKLMALKDDDKTPQALVAMHSVYRDTYAKLESTRTTNLKTLITALSARLTALETDFTKNDRIADATVVRAYRDALIQAGTESITDQQSKPNVAGLKPSASVLDPAAILSAKAGVTNTLGMKLVPVPGTSVLFCIHETRYKDYAAYASEVPGIAADWKSQTFDGYSITERADEHPVTNVTWNEAKDYCEWLSKKEGKTYRLPTDKEWSIAVGVESQEEWGQDTTPETVTKSDKDFPWGDTWPPPKGAGNYSDQSRKGKAPAKDRGYLDGYDDGFPTTAPVMSYLPNKVGLYDMGGNVMEWVSDAWNANTADHVLRGGAWTLLERDSLLSSFRHRSTPSWRSNNYGFRIVLEVSVP